MLVCVGEVCEDQWCLCAYGNQTLQTACSYRGTADGIVNNNKTKSHLSLRYELNLICDVEVCAGLFFLGFIPLPPVIYSLFVHISAERQTDRLANKSLVCTKFYSSCQES